MAQMERRGAAAALSLVLVALVVMVGYSGGGHAVASLLESGVGSDVGGSSAGGVSTGAGMSAVDAGLVHRLSASLATGKGKDTTKSVKQAALDIANVIKDGEKDELKVKQVITRSRTHHGSESAALALEQNLKQLHHEANAKKAKSQTGQEMGAVDKALDLSHAGAQVKMARQEALAIEKVLDESKRDVASADLIEKHSRKGNGSNIWTSFWNSKHSLVSRLAREVGVAKKGSEQAHRR